MKKIVLLFILFSISSCKTTPYEANEFSAPTFLKEELKEVSI